MLVQGSLLWQLVPVPVPLPFLQGSRLLQSVPVVSLPVVEWGSLAVVERGSLVLALALVLLSWVHHHFWLAPLLGMCLLGWC